MTNQYIVLIILREATLYEVNSIVFIFIVSVNFGKYFIILYNLFPLFPDIKMP